MNLHLRFEETVDRMEFAASAGEISIQAAADDGDTKIPTFTMTAYTGSAMNTGYMFYPVVVDLEGVSLHAETVPILRDHDYGRVLGHATAEGVVKTQSSIKVSGVLSGANEHQREVVESSANGFPWRASIGASVQTIEFIKPGASAVVNGKRWAGPVHVARKSRITEVSFVAVPADPKSKAKVAASAQKEGAMTFEAWLKSQKLITASVDELSETRRAALQAAYDAGVKAGTIEAEAPKDVTPDPAPPASPPPAQPTTIEAALQERREAEAAETERLERVRTLTAGHPTIQAQAIREGWSPEKTELAVLRASRPSEAPGAIVRGNGGPPSQDVLECAVMQSLSYDQVEEDYGEQTLEAAHGQFKGRIGLQELLLVAAQAHGYNGGQGPSAVKADLQGVLGFAMPPQHGPIAIQGSFSNLSVPGILSNVANKFLLAAFMAVEQTWRQVSSRRPVNDFKQITSYRLTGDMMYDEVGPDGELKHGAVAEESFTNQAQTYGKMFSVTRQDIINDDLGAFQALPSRIGRGGALKLNLVFWTAFLDNATFFASGNKNYISGAGTAFGISGLTQLETLFLNQVDADGHPLAIDPSVLLVPNALWSDAGTVYRSRECRDTTTDKKTPTSNPHAGKWDPVRSSYLSNTSIPGSSTTGYYLLANPATLSVIEVALLNGKDSPTVETAEADFSVLGIQMRGYHDFGVSLQEHRAGAKSKGAA